MIQRGVLVSVVNHENTSNALSLARRFRERSETMLIDGGSALTEEQMSLFDVVLPNVYYSGLFNETLRLAAVRTDIDVLLFVCSDVLVEEPAHLVDRMVHVFSDASIGVYTPSCVGNCHAFCRRRGTAGIREIPFVDGFIFGIRTSVLNRFHPVDLEENMLGWGIDVYTGYLAASMGLRTVADDSVSVDHPAGTGYDRSLTFNQMLSWLTSHQDGSLRYYKVYQRLQRLSRYRVSRFADGEISALELKLFRWAARVPTCTIPQPAA